MYAISEFNRLVREARETAYLTQRELADKAGTSQSSVAMLEQGSSNPTVDTLVRVARAAGCALYIELRPIGARDPVVERYKQDVDRTLLRENLRKSISERVRTLGEWQQDSVELERATRSARARKRP